MKIAVLPGDGIGPEIVESSMSVLKAANAKFDLGLSFDYDDVGFASLDKYGTTLRDEVLEKAKGYDGIILDPPKFGRGPEGEVWRLEEHLASLIEDCRQLLDSDSRFLFLTVYAVRMSAIALGNLLQTHFADLPGKVEFGELAVREQARGLLLPTAIFARWSQ